MNDYDTRCGWCDARYSTRWERAEHEKEEHGTVTDEQVNRIMSGQDKMVWDTHETERLGLTAVVRDLEAKHKPFAGGRIGDVSYRPGDEEEFYGKALGPGLSVTVPRAPTTSPFPPDMRPATRWGDDLPLPEDKVACLEGEEFMAGTDDGITDADLAPQMLVTAGAICQQAADITAGDRQQQNGDKLPNHENIAALWSAYLSVPIDAHQAATMMVLLKVARTKLGAFNTDDYVDMAGYAGCAAEIRHRSNQEQK